MEYLGFAVAAALGGVALVQRAELRRARTHWADAQRDLTALTEAIEARDETRAARLMGIHHARTHSVPMPDL